MRKFVLADLRSIRGVKTGKGSQAPAPGYTEEARAYRVRGAVILRAVFCRDGKVTNVEVISGLPYGLTEKAVESTLAMSFEPAQKDGEAVSQSFRREMTFFID